MSAFCLTVEANSSIEAAVSSSEAACSSVRLDRSVLPAEISREPTLISSTPRRTVATVRVRLSCMRFNAANSWPISLLLRTSTRAVRSPAAILSKCWPASLSGRTTRRPNTVRATSIRTKASTTAAVTAIRARSKLVRAASMVACCCSLMYLLKSPMAAMKAALRGVPYSLLTM